MLPESIEQERKVGQIQRDSFARAHKAGVKIGFGTDAGVHPHGGNANQFRVMVQYGMTPMQAIQAATIVNAELFGLTRDIGSIANGKYADLIAVQGDPLGDVRELERVRFVMKGGKVYKDELNR